MRFPTKKELQGALNKLLQTLGFVDKVKNKEMTQEDWAKFGQSFEQEHGISIQAAIEELNAANQEPTLTEEAREQIITAVTDACATAGVDTPKIDESSTPGILAGMLSTMQVMASNIQAMERNPEPSQPVAVVGASQDPASFARMMGHAPHSETHLFGIENDYFKRGTWWNELVATGKGKEQYTDEDATEFRTAFGRFQKDFKARCSELVNSNQIGLLDFNKMVHGESYIDYTSMNNKLGEFTIRRFDMIIAYLRTLKSVSNIFPVVSGIQNLAKAPTAHFGELSQSYLSGHNFKGAINLDGEIYHVDDVMFKFLFDDPKQLEKEYIGNMNREGSNPMKWNFFEWCIVHFGTILHNEQQRRRVVGVKVPRQGNFPQPAMFAADGALRAMERSEEELKVLPFMDLGVYTEATMVDYASTFWKYVMAILPNMQNMVLHINEKHQPWYIEGYDEKYGQKTDYTGPKNNIRHLSPDSIVWVPNMEMTDYKMWITNPGNVENYELVPYEMYALYFQQDIEALIMASWWKEGSGVLAPGVQFASQQDLINSKRKLQWIFTNYPASALDPGATTIDGSLNTLFITGENTAAAAITNITDFSVERVYKIVCGSMTNASTIAKSGNFSEITADWTPAAVGDYIKVYAQLHEVTKTVGGKTFKVVEPTGKFLELERKVTV